MSFSKHYRDLHNTRKTIFFRLKKDAVKRMKELDNPKMNVFKVLDGENKGKWCLHITNEQGVKL